MIGKATGLGGRNLEDCFFDIVGRHLEDRCIPKFQSEILTYWECDVPQGWVLAQLLSSPINPEAHFSVI